MRLRRVFATLLATMLALAASVGSASGAQASSACGLSTFAQMQAAFTAGGTVTLCQDLDLTGDGGLVIPATSAVTLNLAGYALTVVGTTVDSLTGQAGIQTTGASLTINGPGSLTAHGGAGGNAHDDEGNGSGSGSGIGGSGGIGSAGMDGGSVTINGGTVTAIGGDGIWGGSGSGIGGGGIGDYEGFQAPVGGGGGSVTINGGTVSATGGGGSAGGSGIGGGGIDISSGGTGGGSVTINGGTVTATGSLGGAGIGGGFGGNGGSVAIAGGLVTATGAGNPGIGGTSAGPVTISDGVVTATGGSESPGIGGIRGGNGPVVIGAGAQVVAQSGNGSPTVVDSWSGPIGSVTNSGSLTLIGNQTNTGPWANTATGVIHLDTRMAGSGTVTNDGAILLDGGYFTPSDGGSITHHGFLVGYSTDPVGTLPTLVFARSFASALANTGQPVLKTPPHGDGWFNANTCKAKAITSTTDLQGVFGPQTYGPSSGSLPNVVLQAEPAATLTFNAQGGSPRPEAQTVVSGCATTAPRTPARSGYTFAGWYTKAIGGTAFDFARPLRTNTTVHAHWTPISTATPQVTVNPDSVQQGGQITVTGTGFQPGERVKGLIHSKVLALGTRTASSRGTVTFTATIPATFAVGHHTVTLTGLISHRAATGGLTVTATTRYPTQAATGYAAPAPNRGDGVRPPTTVLGITNDKRRNRRSHDEQKD